ncbi:MAG: hypothetical protein ACP5N7_05445 [Candidatus Pacearchaeota archaeon]
MGKLKGLFWESNQAPVKTDVVEPTASPVSEVVQPTKPIIVLGGGTPTAAPSEQYMNLLLQAIEAANIPGYDYLEFRAGLMNMINIIPDEQSRFVATFQAVKPQGVTHALLIETANKYIQTLQAEWDEFAAGYDLSVKSLDVKQNRIQELTSKIQELQAEQAKLVVEISSTESDLQSKRAQFEASFNYVKGQIEGDKAKIDKYLQTL